MNCLPQMLCLAIGAPGLPSLPGPTLPTGPQPTLPSLSALPIPRPGSLPTLATPLAALPIVPADRLPELGPTSAICRFGTPQANLNFGTIPAGAVARAFAQPLLLQVECAQAADFTLSTREPAIALGNAAERSSVPVTVRGQVGSLNGSAWVRLELDGQPLAARRFSIPAASPTVIAATAVVVASPTSDRTPASNGTLDNLVLTHHLYLIDGSAP